MYVVGHCVVTERSGVFASEEVYGEGILGLMFPDYVRCHDWGYNCCFEPWWAGAPRSDRMIQAHLLGDYFVHYGRCTTEHRREGFAYRKMGAFARRYDEFFSRAADAGLREPGPPADSVRGFSHTMVEYTIDTCLARSGVFDSVFPRVHAALGRVASPEGNDTRAWVDDAIKRHRVVMQPAGLEEDLHSFGSRIQMSRSPEEFALYAGVKKFHLENCPESRELLREFLTQGLAEIGDAAIDECTNDCSRFISECMSRESAVATAG